MQLANTAYTIPAGATGMQIYVETDEGDDDFYIDEMIGAPADTVIDGPQTVIRFTRGDLNGDGKINAIDLTLAKRGLMSGFSDLSAQLAADVDGSGKADLADLIWYVKFLTGAVSEFPHEIVNFAD